MPRTDAKNPVYSDDLLAEDEIKCYLCWTPGLIQDMKEVDVDVKGNKQLICEGCWEQNEMTA